MGNKIVVIINIMNIVGLNPNVDPSFCKHRTHFATEIFKNQNKAIYKYYDI